MLTKKTTVEFDQMLVPDLIVAIGLPKDSLEWEELEPFQVNQDWPDRAKEQDRVPPYLTYVWSKASKTEARNIAGTHEAVWLLDKLKRTKQKVELRDGSTLMVEE